MRIRTQLLAFVLTVVLAGFTTILIVSYFSSRKAMVSEIRQKAENIKNMNQEYLNGLFESASKVASGMATAVRADPNISEDKVHALLKENIIWNPQIYGMTIFFEPKPHEKGKKLFAPYYFRHGQLMKYIPARPDFDFEKHDWYSQPKEKALPIWTEPYYDKGANAIMATHSVPIFVGGNFKGLATIDLSLEDLAKKINSIKIGERGYAVLISPSGTFLAHPSPEEYVLKKKLPEVALDVDDLGFRKLAGDIIRGKSGAIEITDPLNGELTWATYTTVPSTGYSLAVFIPKEELFLSVNQLGKNILWISLAVTALLSSAIAAISFRITKPIKDLSESAMKIANGDLNAEIKGSSEKNEVGALTENVQTMVRTIKDMVRAISDEKEKFERVFIAMSDGIVTTDPTWKIVNVNAAASMMLDVKVGSNLMEHISKTFESDFDLKELLDYSKKDKHFDVIKPETDQVGEIIFSGTLNTIFDSDGHISSHVLSVRNVTEERKEELNKSTLLSLISHKLRTPLTVLLNTGYLFKDGVMGDLDERQSKGVRMMMEQSEKLQDLVDKLIGYVAVTSKQEAKVETLNLPKFVKEFVHSRNFTVDHKNPKVELDISDDVVFWSFNKERFELILAELIENSTKFNENDDVVINVRLGIEQDLLVIEVSDNGIGIAPIYHDRVFDKFYQVDKHFTGNMQGMGLGLALVKAFVDSCKGSIRILSKEGAGSVFRMEFYPS